MTRPAGSPPDFIGGPPALVLAGRYRLLGRIGQGGMATVHRARDEHLGREVAVKLLRPHLAHDERVRDRFHREATAAARLTHPGVVTVFEHSHGGADDIPFLVMELVEGGSVADVIRGRGTLRPGQVLALLRPALAGLAAAHGSGIVHRDVTPANVLVTTDGASKLGDFGLARAAAASTSTFPEGVVGSPHYMAPEAVRGEPLRAPADVYSVGCMLFHCLTGRTPFDGPSPQAVAMQHGVTPVPPPSATVPGARQLDQVVARATAIEPDARYADADELLAAFDAAVPGGPEAIDLRDGETDLLVPPHHATTSLVEHPPTVAVTEPRRRPRWRRLLLAVVLLAAVAAGGWVGFDRGVAPLAAIPDVTTMPLGDARTELEEAGFRVRVRDDRVTDPTVPEGAVLAQDPRGEARRRSTVELTVSDGPRTGELPALVGRSLEAATAAVEELALDLRVEVEDGFDDEVPAGTVLSASPAAGATVAEGGTVTLVVSAGPAPVEVPDVVGEGQAAATATLVADGLVATIVEQRHDDAVPEGAVIATQPPAGETLRRGDEVGLVLSLGPAPVEVPDVEGEREADAVAVLQERGFEVEIREVPTLLGLGSGFVDAQDPSAGTVRPRGSTVRLFVWR